MVDPEQYYRDCVYDMCACQVKLGECLCPMIAAYAKECAQKGVLVDWIPDVRECGNPLILIKHRFLDQLIIDQRQNVPFEKKYTSKRI